MNLRRWVIIASIVISLACVLAWCSSTDAAVAFDTAAGVDTIGGTNTSVSFSVTCSGDDRFLAIIIGYRTATGGNPGTVSATYNSNATTAIRSDRADAGVGQTTVYYLNPDTVSRTVACTLSNSQMLGCIAMCFTGVDQDTPFGSADGEHNAAGTTCDAVVSVSAGGLAFGSAISRNSSGTLTTGDTQRHIRETSNATASNNIKLLAATAAGEGSVTLDFTRSESQTIGCTGVPLNSAEEEEPPPENIILRPSPIFP